MKFHFAQSGVYPKNKNARTTDLEGGWYCLLINKEAFCAMTNKLIKRRGKKK